MVWDSINFYCFLSFFLGAVRDKYELNALNMSGLWIFPFLIGETSKKVLRLESLFFNHRSMIRILEIGAIVTGFFTASTYHPRTHWRDGSFLSLTSKALPPEFLIHSSQICQLAQFCNASLLPFNCCHVWIHSPLFSHLHNTSTGPRRSSHQVGTPPTVSSTLRGLAGEKTQAAGGGLCLPESPATLLSHWHQDSAVERWYPLQGGHWGGGATAAHGGNVALAIWTHRTGSTCHHRKNKQVPPVLVLPLWPTSKHTECVSVYVCVCAAHVPVQMKNLDSPTLNSTLFKDMDTWRAAAMERERERETGKEGDLFLHS